MRQRTIALGVGVLLYAIPAMADFLSGAQIQPGSLDCAHVTYSMTCTASGTTRDVLADQTVDIHGFLTTSYSDGRLDEMAHFTPGVGVSNFSGFGMHFSDSVRIIGYTDSGFVQFEPIVFVIVGAQEVFFHFYFTGVGTRDSPLSSYDRGELSPLIPFDSGTFDMSGGLTVSADNLGGGDAIPGSQSFLYANIHLYDSNIQPLVGYAFEYASDVPEPNGWILLASVLSVVVLGYQRRRRIASNDPGVIR